MSKNRAQFFASLARLTGAGLPVEKAGDILRDHSLGQSTRSAIESLKDGIARGTSIADALRPSLTQLEFSMINAAESGGQLSDGFAHLEKYYTLLADARSRMWRAAVYPLCILHVAALATGVIAHLSERPPLPSLAMSLGILWVSLFAIYRLSRLIVAEAAKSRATDSLLRALPFVAPVWRHLALTRWSAVMHFHIISGQKFSTALESAASASASANLSAATLRLAHAASDGESIAAAMKRESVFPPHFVLGFATGEATGALDQETAAQTRQCMADATSAMEVLSEWLPRLLYFAAAIYAVWQIYQLAMGIGGQYQRAFDSFK